MEKKIILFGAGIYGQRAFNFYQADRVFCFADNYKAGQEFCGKSIISFDELKRIHSDYDVIISASFVVFQQLKIQCAEHDIPAQVWEDVVSYKDYASNPEIAKYRDKHKGERCFIVGNAPSLRAEDLDELHKHNEVSFGCNVINRIYPQTEWRPLYYVACDPSMLTTHAKEILSINASAYFFPSIENNYCGKNLKMKDIVRELQGDVCFYNKITGYSNMEFSPDPSRAMRAIATVAIEIIQLAAYMGFDKIYLTGVDGTQCSIKDPIDYFSTRRHFYEESLEEYNEAENTQPLIDKETHFKFTADAYAALETYSREHGFRIYNATRGGAVEAFERVDFDSLF